MSEVQWKVDLHIPDDKVKVRFRAGFTESEAVARFENGYGGVDESRGPITSELLSAEGLKLWGAIVSAYPSYHNGFKAPQKDQHKSKRVKHTYFIRNESGHIKIGVSMNVKDRFSTLQTSSSTLLELVFVIPKDVEKSLHKKFSRQRIHPGREWFYNNEGVITKYIDSVRPRYLNDEVL